MFIISSDDKTKMARLYMTRLQTGYGPGSVLCKYNVDITESLPEFLPVNEIRKHTQLGASWRCVTEISLA